MTKGEFFSNRVNGYAILQNNITKYEGLWENDKLNGLCIENWKDGAYYEGEYTCGQRNGLGMIK